MNLINKIHENTIKKTSDVKLHKKKQAKIKNHGSLLCQKLQICHNNCAFKKKGYNILHVTLNQKKIKFIYCCQKNYS